jgi:hypothetical protein
MSMTPDEAAYEEYMSRLYDEHKQDAVEQFTGERLQSYFLDNKLLAQPALNALITARNLINTNATAAFIFATIATEVGLKETLLKPIVFGLVHTESLASLITDLTISHAGMDRYRELLLRVLRDHGGVDLDSFRRSGSDKLIWEEIRSVQKKRNGILHRAETASADEANTAIGVASAIVETIFSAVATNMGFHFHENLSICNDWKCKYEGTSLKTIFDRF